MTFDKGSHITASETVGVMNESGETGLLSAWVAKIDEAGRTTQVSVANQRNQNLSNQVFHPSTTTTGLNSALGSNSPSFGLYLTGPIDFSTSIYRYLPNGMRNQSQDSNTNLSFAAQDTMGRFDRAVDAEGNISEVECYPYPSAK